MTTSIRYKHYLVSPVSTLEFGGTYRSRAALISFQDGRPKSQRFVDFERCSTKAAADERAIEGGKAWIDDRLRDAKTSFRTDFDTLV